MAEFHPTPRMLEGAYDFLRLCPPFNRWKLPAGETVQFRVTRHKLQRGACWRHNGTGHFCIDISARLLGSNRLLVETMAHEMIHVRDWMDGIGNKIEHGISFQRRAKLVCQIHGFDYKAFV